MDEPQAHDTDRSTSDLSIYVLALIATVVIVFGLFAWIRIDPVVPTLPPVRDSTQTPR